MQIFQRRFKAALGMAVDAVLPPRCVVSGENVERQGMVSPATWQSLDFIAEPFCHVCGLPFDFKAEANSLCLQCLEDRPDFKTARAALKYNEASRSLILGFKHADKTHVALAFLPWLKRAGADMLKDVDYIVPVPLHYRRLVSRRYNQSMLIARVLAREVSLPLLPDALKRIRATPSQGHLSAKERLNNVKGAFVLNERYAEMIKGKAIVLVDDVYTTGATVNECAKALLRGGSGPVHVLTLARVARS